MDPVIEPSSEPELHLLADWTEAAARPRWREAATGSIAAHITLLILLATLPNSAFFAPRREIVTRTTVTPLVMPRFELTQPDPHRGNTSTPVTMDTLRPRPSTQIPRAAPSPTRPAAPAPGEPVPFVAPPAPPPRPAPAAPQIPEEAPKIETANNNPLPNTPPMPI